MSEVRLMLGDCLELMREIPDDSVDAVVTDPPAGIAFMGKDWDDPEHFPLRDRGPRLTGSGNPTESRGFANGITFDKSRKGRDAFIDFLTPRMAEAYRIARPGSYALVWALPRTSHLTATAVEDAGWTIRDRVTHLFGTGFPKAKSCLKPGAEDWWLAYKPGGKMAPLQIDACRIATDEKLGRLNNSTSTFNAKNSTPWVDNSGGLGRWPANVVLDEAAAAMLDAMSGERGSGRSDRGNRDSALGRMNDDTWKPKHTEFQYHADSGGASRFFKVCSTSEDESILDYAMSIIETWTQEFASTADSHSSLSSEHVVSALRLAATLASHGATGLSVTRGHFTGVTRSELRSLCESVIVMTQSFAARFSPGQRHEKPTRSRSLASDAETSTPTGITTITASLSRFDGSAAVVTLSGTFPDSGPGDQGSARRFIYTPKASRADRGEGNTHPTIKSESLMRWLCRLITPTGGTVLDPFTGSGSTGKAAVLEGFGFLGIERDPGYFAIAERRIADARNALPLLA